MNWNRKSSQAVVRLEAVVGSFKLIVCAHENGKFYGALYQHTAILSSTEARYKSESGAKDGAVRLLEHHVEREMRMLQDTLKELGRKS